MGFIYKITNTVSKKCYIGETIQDPEKRWKDHKNAIKRDGGCRALKNAIKKYGINNFKFEVLIICFDEDRLEYEKEYIKKYNSLFPNGYNILEGGQEGVLGLKHTDETKRKISEFVKKRFTNPVERQKARDRFKIIVNSPKWKEARKNIKYDNRTKTNYTLSESTKNNISYN